MSVTVSANKASVEREWFKLDAKDQVMGRLATGIASVLRGKHKPTFTPHCDTGDYVVVLNSDLIQFTGKKLNNKRHYWHTGYPGGLKSASMQELMDKNSAEVLRRAVRRMLPKGPLGRAMLLKLKIYRDDQHPHIAQQLKDWPFAQDQTRN